MTSTPEWTPDEKSALLAALENKPNGFIAKFFITHSLGLAYDIPGQYASKANKIASAMLEAERTGKQRGIYEALEALAQTGKIRVNEGDRHASPYTGQTPSVSEPWDKTEDLSSKDSVDGSLAVRPGKRLEVVPATYSAVPAAKQSEEEQLTAAKIDAAIADVGSRIKNRARRFASLGKVLVFVVSAGVALSPILPSIGLPLDLSGFVQHPVVLTIAGLLALLQLADWLWPGAPIGAYRSGASWLILKIATVQRRRAITALLASHGSDELARRHLPASEARYYAVTQQSRRRRRRRRVGYGVAVLTGLLVASTYLIVRSTNSPMYTVGQEFALSSQLSLVVLRDLSCQDNACSLAIRFRNTSGAKMNYCPPAFGSIEPYGPHYRVGQYGNEEYGFATAVRIDGALYRLSSQGEQNGCYPGAGVEASFTYDVPTNVQPGRREALFTAKGNADIFRVALN